jgi:hypothetical protein
VIPNISTALRDVFSPATLAGFGGVCVLLAGGLFAFGWPGGLLAGPSTQAPEADESHSAVPTSPAPLPWTAALFGDRHGGVSVPYRPSYRPLPRTELNVLQGVRYDDPTGGGVPLRWVDRQHDPWLSPGLRLSDFAAHDGAPMVRVAPALVEGMERIRVRAGQLVILSGYRHPAHNATVGGAGDSQHQAGKAADIWSPEHTPLELARFALEEMGCEIGLGLGPRSLHVDVRGELATWTYEDADLPGPTFTAWVYAQCGQPVPADVAARAASRWLDEEGADAEAAPATRGATPEEALLARFEPALIAAAARAHPTVGPGAAVVDLQAGGSPAVRYLAQGDPALTALRLDDLVAWCAGRAYFAYAILRPDAPPLTGVMSL